MYDKFTRDYKTDAYLKHQLDVKKQIEYKLKLKENLARFKNKLFPQSKIFVVNNDYMEREQRREASNDIHQGSEKAESIVEIEKQYQLWL